MSKNMQMKKETGKTPQEHIQTKVIELAKEKQEKFYIENFCQKI